MRQVLVAALVLLLFCFVSPPAGRSASPNGKSVSDCVGLISLQGNNTRYPPGCYGHDEPIMSFVSSAADSGTNAIFHIILPSSSANYPQGYFYATFWFGGVVYDTSSLNNSAYLEFQFYPASPTATGANRGSQDCWGDGSFHYQANSLSSNQWFACAIVWAENPQTNVEYAAIGLPLDSTGGMTRYWL